ncbi:DUF3262 family protein [Lampropedia puyangensis]|uniref:DUF3262 family protein n=1 Tax=Lampropedia puyangensis TaxID=1330072 RepID=A0A4S8EVY7_9BURK|nr:DUF3262 family protein [Lampropedia puyangensis]THT98420.1 DUF3262 family protein [Lampropedia puyangensis]
MSASRSFLQYVFFSLLVIIAGLAIAKTYVTADQVAQAIRQSPNANQWLRDNADAVGRLAMFESGGQLDVYNQSCCYGVLQMNTQNLDREGYKNPSDYMNAPLQDQVNAWANVMSQALNTKNPQALAQMGIFDGREVTGDMVLACVQLGIGNCGTMIRSGSCSGFADINGTTICSMADRIRDGSHAGGGSSGTGGIPGYGSSSGSGGDMTYHPSTYEGASFESGSGQNPDDMRKLFQGILLAVATLVIAFGMLHSWKSFARGQIAVAHFKRHMVISGVTLMFIIAISAYL